MLSIIHFCLVPHHCSEGTGDLHPFFCFSRLLCGFWPAAHLSAALGMVKPQKTSFYWTYVIRVIKAGGVFGCITSFIAYGWGLKLLFEAEDDPRFRVPLGTWRALMWDSYLEGSRNCLYDMWTLKKSTKLVTCTLDNKRVEYVGSKNMRLRMELGVPRFVYS